MWMQQYDPFQNEYVSALVAAIPILFFLFTLAGLKMKGIVAAGLTLLVSLAVSVLAFDIPIAQAVSATFLGVAKGLWPIGYIVLMAVWLYKIAVKTGKFTVIRSSIASISTDQRLQLLLIGFSFNAFLEGAAGFGVPIAICAALLVELGFRPLKAAALCLIANAASGAFGAIGIPVIVGAQMGNMETMELSRTLAFTLPMISFAIPFLLVFILDGFKGVMGTFPALLVVSGLYTGTQLVTILWLGPELANILAALISMGGLAIFLRKWQPATIYREEGATSNTNQQSYSILEIIKAWSPFYILTATITIWSLPAFKALFSEGGALSFTTRLLKTPFLHEEIAKTVPIAPEVTALEAVFKLDLLSATGTAILVAVLLTGLFSNAIKLNEGFQSLQETTKELWIPILTICFVMGFASLSNYAGLSSSIGLALSKTGDLFPMFSPILGWIGVFITGSVVSNNALFGHLQMVTANQIATTPALLLGANTAGGVMAKLISPQSIAIATAAVKQTGQESTLFTMTLRYSIALLAIICLWTYLLSVAVF
ncbi:L-lactate permease [Pontibacillus halophilus JSM 076056 = DSM 19796]|uniref:L-lactate permease n=1 Tax=Pontibacillus halophilus JSM 076056 = DSM 19796 TaxID=1385510 RepID=A0A0A5GKB8_9BACI|nr:L-lactate permease [Pontibacillus halophilus]KGX93731.1 L-lactate permease [Pontibacillus halophilus JSM 076056 = DSM 19796]